ncbi:MAG TPA: sensor histidine kinase [Solirubrobacteraceae bacterium]|jgi:signal transduction histidine kinase
MAGMRALRPALAGLALVAAASGVLLMALVMTSDHAGDRWIPLVLGPLIGWSFTGTGLYAWARRPENRIGPLMVAIGFAWLLAELTSTDVDVLHSVGLLAETLPWTILVHMLLAFPSGRVRSRLERGFLFIGYGILLPLQLLFVVTFDPLSQRCGCPENLFLVARADGVADAAQATQSAVGLAGVLALAWVIARRWREAQAGDRRALRPVLLAGGVTVGLLVVTLAADLTSLNDTAEEVIDVAGEIAMGAVPFAFLVGLLRSRLSRASAVAALIERLGAGDGRRGTLHQALADALGEPDLVVAYRVSLPDAGEGYVDADGAPVDLAPTPGTVWTPVELEGRTVGALRHSAALEDEDPGAVRTVAAAAALALENERLQAELRARIEELRRSRARLVEAADAERRRLERDLHDGAQQRLVALALNLRLARSRVEKDPAAAAELLDESREELAHATAELRELARGIHPAILTERGLGPAVGALASRAGVPVEVGALPGERLPAPIEAAAYFVVSEAITNVDRYARAAHASVTVERVNGHVVVEVRDDGVGGADPAAGTGLRGLADRVAALDGRLEVRSPAGGGTTLRAELPCGS